MVHSPQVSQFERQIREKLPTHNSPEDAAAAVRSDAANLGFSFSPEMQNNLDIACANVKNSLENVEILRRSSIIKTRKDWYTGPGLNDRHWPALYGFLTNTKGWDSDSVDSIESTSSEVVSLLADPNKAQFRCRGLVVGYVQSGKTANMTAVIAKAVDAGYNLVVLLGGMTNKLRAQTQGRLEADIVDRHRHLWQLYTTTEEGGDFTFPPNGSFTMPVSGRAQLVVMKKITSRLNAFIRTIERTPPNILRSLKVLMIDDECDQASVNSAKEDYDITKINEAIRKIIKALPSISYVGYTATPFANVFIDPFPHNREELDDLYPEDFITSLPKPDQYFGAEAVFGKDPVDADVLSDEEEGRDMIRHVPTEELDLLCPRPASAPDFWPSVSPSLENAILWFIATCAVRRRRGQVESHMTMLVHTSPLVLQHQRMAEQIVGWLQANKDGLRNRRGDAFGRLSDLLEKELKRQPFLDEENISSATAWGLLGEIGAVLDALEIVVENSKSDERLDYTGDPKTYIVVGGAVLARGLTLEGLCVSFFLRTAKQYDTLLQMGRWFGYRHGYEDLPRLWTTEDLASSFRALARIEAEIREDIETYRERPSITPLDFAVRVRAIPGMAITSATKMKHALRTSISYEGRHVQTIRFDHLNADVVAGNWKAASDLVDNLGEASVSQSDATLWKGVPAEKIRKFLTHYDISEHHMDLKKSLLLGFFDRAKERLPEWNVGVLSPTLASSPSSGKLLGVLGNVPLFRRSRLTGSGSTFADIKALMSKQDILVDAETRPEPLKNVSWTNLKRYRPAVPLLLLYPIDRESRPQRKSDKRTTLDAVDDLIGIGIVFPGESDRSGDYYQVTIDAPTPEELDEQEVIDEQSESLTDTANA